MDEKDELILRVLERDGKLSSRDVAAEAGLPVSTAHRRIRRMEQDGVIKRYKAVIDYEKTERSVGAFIFINEAETIPSKGHIPKSRIIDEIGKFGEVQELADVQGANFDLVVKARFRSIRELSSFTEKMRAVEGIDELFAAIIVQEFP